MWIINKNVFLTDLNIVKKSLKLEQTDTHFWTIRIQMKIYFIILRLFGLIASELLLIDFKYFRDIKIKLLIFFC